MVRSHTIYHSRDVLPSQWRSAKHRSKEGDQHAALSARSRRTPRGLGRPDALSAQLTHSGECGDGQVSGRVAVWPSSGSLRRGCSAPSIGRATRSVMRQRRSRAGNLLIYACARDSEQRPPPEPADDDRPGGCLRAPRAPLAAAARGASGGAPTASEEVAATRHAPHGLVMRVGYLVGSSRWI